MERHNRENLDLSSKLWGNPIWIYNLLTSCLQQRSTLQTPGAPSSCCCIHLSPAAPRGAHCSRGSDPAQGTILSWKHHWHWAPVSRAAARQETRWAEAGEGKTCTKSLQFNSHLPFFPPQPTAPRIPLDVAKSHHFTQSTAGLDIYGWIYGCLSLSSQSQWKESSQLLRKEEEEKLKAE